jgi:hypothetical protein
MKTKSIGNLLLCGDEELRKNYFTDKNMSERFNTNLKNHININRQYKYIPNGRLEMVTFIINSCPRMTFQISHTYEGSYVLAVVFFYDIGEDKKRKINLIIQEYKRIRYAGTVMDISKLNVLLKSKRIFDIYDYEDVDKIYGNDVGNLIKEYLY